MMQAFVDFNIKSDITSKDDNYWDRLHYREPIADRIVADLAEALTTGKDDPNGDWRVLVPPARLEQEAPGLPDQARQ